MRSVVNRHARWLAVACAVAGAVGTVASAASAAPSTSNTIRVALVPASHTSLLPQMTAAQGYFKKYGLNVTLATPSIPFTELPNALGRQYDLIVSGTPTAITGRAHNLDLALAGFIFQNVPSDPTAALVVPADSPIHSVADLAGKTVGATSITSSNWTTLECWAQKQGLNPQSIRGVEAPTAEIPDLLEHGRFDAALVLGPGYEQLRHAGYRVIGDSYVGCFGGNTPSGALIGLGSWVKSHQSTLARFEAALKQGQKYMVAHPAKVTQYWVKNSGLPAAAAKISPPNVRSFAVNFSRPFLVKNAQLWLKTMRKLHLYSGNLTAGQIVG